MKLVGFKYLALNMFPCRRKRTEMNELQKKTAKVIHIAKVKTKNIEIPYKIKCIKRYLQLILFYVIAIVITSSYWLTMVVQGQSCYSV